MRRRRARRQSLRRGLAAAALLALAAACARIENPPGGPPDRTPPQLVGTRPDSVVVLPGFSGDAEFVFDETVNEGSSPNFGAGTGDLERLVVLSPSDRVPDVRWRRGRIAVRPGEGWRPDRVYRIELLPGIADLRNNRSDARGVITFTTGAPVPRGTLTGSVTDWTNGQPARGALVAARLLPDSLDYRTFADSAGRFRLGPLPAGSYLVYGVIDQSRDQRLSGREAFDTVRIALDTAAAATATADLWTFPHDTTGPRIQNVAVADSSSAAIQLTQPLDPTQRFDSSAVRLRLLPDSARTDTTRVAVVSLLPKRIADSVRGAVRRDTARADSLRADSLRADSLPGADSAARGRARPARPPLDNTLVLRVAEPWRAGGRYLIELFGIRNANRVAADSAAGTLVVPEVRRDTTAAPRDTSAADSLPRPPADSAPRRP